MLEVHLHVSERNISAHYVHRESARNREGQLRDKERGQKSTDNIKGIDN